MTEFFALHPLTVIKLGGSLLDLPDLSDRLQAFFSRHHFERPVIIPGGGQLADEVRRLDVRHRAWEMTLLMSWACGHWR